MQPKTLTEQDFGKLSGLTSRGANSSGKQVYGDATGGTYVRNEYNIGTPQYKTDYSYTPGANAGNTNNNPATPTQSPTGSVLSRPIYGNEPAVTEAKTEEEIQAEMKASAQAEIDNLNKYYDTLRAEQGLTNEKNLRSTNAISALTGLGGSTEADVAEQTTTAGNNRANAKIEQERAIAIGSILSKIRSSALDEARQQRQEARQSEQNRISYREKAQQEAVTNLTMLSKSNSGATLEGLKATLKPEEYDYLVKNAGGEAMAKAILFENRPQNTLIGSPTNVGGHIVQYFKTPTGEVKSETVPLPDGVSPDAKLQKIGNKLYSSSDGGNTWKAVVSASGKATGGSGSGKVIKSGKAVFTGTQMSAMEQTLQFSKTLYNGDGVYVNPEVYKQAYDAWIEAGGISKDFIANFPPDKYVNPTNDQLPTYLRSTKKTKAQDTAIDPATGLPNWMVGK